MPGRGTHNVLYVATEHDSVFAFDADNGAILWQISVLQAGETTSDARSCKQVMPEIGITATPVIEPGTGPHGTIYVVGVSKNSSGAYFQRIHALDLATGAEEFGGPVTIQASFPGTGANSQDGFVIFDPAQYKERASLLWLGGQVYTSWASDCDAGPYTGWIIGYDGATLAQSGVFNVTPNGGDGAIWGSGAGPAADSQGNIYLLDANGTFDTTLNSAGFPSDGDFGNAFIKLSTVGSLHVADYFEMFNTVAESNLDQDLGSGGALLLPDMVDSSGRVRHLAVGAGKDENIYLVDRDQMGHFNSHFNNIYQELPSFLQSPEFGMPAYFDGTLYYGAWARQIVALPFSQARLSPTPASVTGNTFGYPGATPSISANGVSDAILWAAENGDEAVLHAYNARDLSQELYNSNQAANGRDHFGTGNKFITPTIANGKVYVGTTDGVGVFGLLSQATTTTHP